MIIPPEVYADKYLTAEVLSPPMRTLMKAKVIDCKQDADGNPVSIGSHNPSCVDCLCPFMDSGQGASKAWRISHCCNALSLWIYFFQSQSG